MGKTWFQSRCVRRGIGGSMVEFSPPRVGVLGGINLFEKVQSMALPPVKVTGILLVHLEL
jgi:hypothetical protein